MLGLLGGLLGGGMLRRGGGGGSSMPTYSARAPQSTPMAPEPQEASGQTRAQKPQESPAQQPAEQPMVQQAAQEVSKGQPAPQQQQQTQTPLAGLMDEAKPQAAQPKTDKPEPPQFVNKTPTPTPVAKQQDEMLGQVPQLQKPEMIANQLLDSGTNRQRMEFQSGMPDKHFDTGGSDWTPPIGLSYQQPTTVAGSVPARKYRV